MVVNKYKIGDRVKVVGRLQNSWHTSRYLDKVGTVEHIITFNKHDDVAYNIRFDHVRDDRNRCFNLWHADLLKIENANDILKGLL